MIKPDIKLIESDKDVDAEVLTTYKRLRVFSDSEERTKWLEMRKKNRNLIDKNEIWNSDEEKEMTDAGMVPLVINDVVKGVQGSAAVATNQKPKIIVKPVGGSDLYIAELIQRGFNFIWRKNNGNAVVYKNVIESKTSGLGSLTCWHDPYKGIFGRIKFKNTKPTQLYFSQDSEEDDFSDTDVIIAQLRTKKYILENYPSIEEDELYFASGITDEPQKSSGVIGEDNYAVGEKEKAILQDELKQIWEIEHWELKVVTEPWVIVKDGEDFKPIPLELEKNEKPEQAVSRLQKTTELLELEKGFIWKRQLQKRIQKIIVGKKMISKITQPYGMDSDGDPVMGIIALKHWDTDTAYPTCPTTFALPLAKERSKRRAQLIMATSYAMTSPLVRTKGTKWIGKPGKSGSELEVDKNTPAHAMPHRLGMENFPLAALIKLEEMASQGIDDLFDMQDVVKGKMPPGERAPSGRVVLALQDKAGVMSTPFQSKLEETQDRLAKVIIVLMLRHWPQYMWRQMIDESDFTSWTPEGKQEPDEGISQKWIEALERVRPNDMAQQGLGLVDIDISVEAGSSLPTNRILKEALAIEKYKEGLYDRETALEYADDPLKDKAIKRMKAVEAAQAEAEMMKGAR